MTIDADKNVDEYLFCLEMERGYKLSSRFLKQKIYESQEEQDPEWKKDCRKRYFEGQLKELEPQISQIQQMIKRMGLIGRIMLREEYDKLTKKENKIGYSLRFLNSEDKNKQNFAERIKQAKSQSIFNLLGILPTRRNISCPFHEDKTPSFHVYEEGANFRCYSCGSYGDAIDFFMKLNSCDFGAAIKALT